MLPPLGTSPGSQWPTVSPSDSRCSATSCSTTVATKVLVTLPTRTRSPGAMGVCVATSARPLVATVTRPPWRTSPIAPGTPSLTICWMAAWNGDGAGAPARTPAPAGAAAATRTDTTATMAAATAAARARAARPIGRPENHPERDAGGRSDHRRPRRIVNHLKLVMFCLLPCCAMRGDAGYGGRLWSAGALGLVHQARPDA